MQIVRIELGDGDYAELYNEITHKTSKCLQRLIRTSLGDNGTLELQAKLSNAPDMQAKRDILKDISLEGEDEIIILNQTVKWSFGEVNQSALDVMSDIKYQMLKAEVDKLYSQPPLVVKS